ncbi:MAG: hypothetical protein ACRENF_03595, partial [Thermodesulfobacteriota bacterium]
MTSVLIVLAFIIAVALLFWLDEKDKEDREEGKRIFTEVSELFKKIDWETSIAELKEGFSEKEFLNFQENSNSFTSKTYKDKLDGLDVLVHFYLPKDESGKIARVEIQFAEIRKDKLDVLFGKLCEKYGIPLLQNVKDEKPVLWDMEKGILMLEKSGSQRVHLSLWNK